MEKERKIKIVHLTEAWQGGIATYVDGLIKYQAVSGNFNEIYLICAKGKTPNFGRNYPAKQRFYSSSRSPIKFFHIAREVKRIIEGINPDIIHVHSTFAGVYSRILPIYDQNGNNIPIVYCAHGWSFGQDTLSVKKSIYKIVERYLAKNTKAIINVSRNDYNISIKAGIKHPINRILLSCARHSNKQVDHNPIIVDNDKVNIGFIGRLDYQKGFDLIAEQIPLCNRNDIKLHVIGEGVLGDRKVVMQDGFNHIGWVDEKVIDDYIKMLDVVVVPSRWEGLGLVMLEAFRNAKPVIASNRGPLLELVVEGFNGYIFDFDNPKSFRDIISKLNKKELKRMGVNALSVFEHAFSNDNHFVETTKLYKELVS